MTIDADARPWLDDAHAPLRMLLDPRGRIARRAWWLWSVAVPLMLALLLHALLDIARVQAASAERLVSLVLAWPLLAVNAKRLHDRGRSGAWALALLVPVLGWLWLMAVNGSLRGTAGANRYGPPPSG
ncbi:MAG: DUF805 domain-containing protein [Burkholderiales bacterium]|nr:DUF805 domain-containing protein [Burkholderiales bacterium]